MVRQQTDTDRDIMELRRLMDKIDMCHHDKYEKLVLEHDSELGNHFKITALMFPLPIALINQILFLLISL